MIDTNEGTCSIGGIPVEDIAALAGTPVYVYDTSGPYTDPHAHIDLRAGLPALRTRWIEERDDSETLHNLTSEFGRRRVTQCR